MPELVDKIEQGALARIMLVGDAMLRKTTWAVGAAEAGFNVIYVDGDGNSQPLNKLSKEAQRRVKYLDAVDTSNDAVMAWLSYYILFGNTFKWHERDKKAISGFGVKPDADLMVFDQSKLTSNDIIVFDSWTAYVKSLVRRYMQEEQVDIAQSVTIDSDWKDYRWTGLMADWFLEQIKTLPCHVIVIAHNELNEKKDKKGNVISQKLQAISTSRTQATKMPKYFTEIIYFELAGTTTYLDTKPSDTRVAGTRSIEPFRKTWEEMQFKTFAGLCGIKSSGATCDAVRFGKAADILGQGKAPLGVAVTSNTPAPTTTLPPLTQTPTPEPTGQPPVPVVNPANTGKVTLSLFGKKP